ncbi:ATP-binding protein [Actinomadura logoneensis]|uniref:ATP-binding protein n=1 Tax=Actinomadura logoneensis TaxID=2293572 RepID=A0A372JBL9_9ACTN|nr:ATP-binding protein [Actinomadura logoneensis]RFU37405.1 ATP-binding protein [Actinomadura logoneensis]
MKVAFVGKGGSGKTTTSSLFIRHLAAERAPVVAIDADINQHLGVALGMTEEEAADVPALGAHLAEIKEYLRGENPRIASTAEMVKTTPPGRGSRLLRFDGHDPVHALSRQVDGVTFMATGPFDESDLGVSCYHGKTGAMEMYLNHLVDGPGEYVVADMTAGADTFASGLFTRFDLLFLVVEPTRKGVAVYRQYTGHASDFGVRIAVVGNKVQTAGDEAFLREHVGSDLLAVIGHQPAVRAMEQGRPFTLDALDDATRKVLRRLQDEVDAQSKDWDRYQRLACEFHVRNAESWANKAVGVDLTRQIDPGFRLGPEAAASTGTGAAATGTGAGAPSGWIAGTP